MSKMRLVFSSVRTDPRPGTIAAILRSSRENNSRDGVTGLLLSDQQRFVQLLEGEPASLDRCFSRIRNDSRHRDISVLVSEETPALLFPDAPMQGVEAEETGLQVVAALSPDSSPALVMNVFEALARRSAPSPAPQTGGALLGLRRIRQAARHVLDDSLAHRHLRPETLARLQASLMRQLEHATELRQRAATDPEHHLEASQLCDLLEAAQREVARRLERQG